MPSLVTTLEFHEPCLTDASWMVPILRAADNKACEYSFTTIFMWRKYYENQVVQTFLSAQTKMPETERPESQYIFLS